MVLSLRNLPVQFKQEIISYLSDLVSLQQKGAENKKKKKDVVLLEKGKDWGQSLSVGDF